MHSLVEEWWVNEIRGWDDPKRPFLDAKYSTYKPAIDVTLKITGWLQAGEYDAIINLLGYLDGGALRRASKLYVEGLLENYSNSTNEGGQAEYEWNAIYLLATFQLSTQEVSAFDLGRLAYMSLGMNWKIGDESYLRSPLVSSLRELPPTTRYMILLPFLDDGDGYWAKKVNGITLLRPSLDYGMRCYGNNSSWNLHFADWLNCWESNYPKGFTAKEITKDALITGLNSHCIDTKKSMRKGELVRMAESDPKIWNEVWAKAAPDWKIFKEEAAHEFRQLANYITNRRTKVSVFVESYVAKNLIR